MSTPGNLGTALQVLRLNQSVFESLAPWARVGLFRGDLLWAAILVPGLIYLASKALPPRTVLAINALAGSACVLVMLPEALAYSFVGRFLSIDFIKDSFQWGKANYQDFRFYVGFHRVAYFAVAMLASPILALVAARGLRWELGGAGRKAIAAVWVVPALAGLAGWLTPAPSTGSAALLVWRGLAPAEGLVASRFDGLTPEQQDLEYRHLALVPEPQRKPVHWAQARDYDVILFVLETSFVRGLDTNGALEHEPNFRKLKQTSWVGSQHLSTFPYTNRAMFSMLTSQYPPEHLNHLYMSSAPRVESLVGSLHNAGYSSGLYMPVEELFFYEKQMYRSLGFDKVVRKVEAKLNRVEWTWESVTARDRATLRQMREDIEKWSAANQRYLAVFLPQAGHEPWIREPGAPLRTPIADRHAISRFEDEMFGELMQTLVKTGRADRTIIVVTGDHGARRRERFPDYQSAQLEYQFHVPFLLSAPGLLRKTEVIPWVTSHIDVAPSVLDLLGVGGQRAHAMGSPVWDERLRDRTTFLFANGLFGFDAYHHAGEFRFWNRTHDEVYVSKGILLDEGSQLQAADPRFAETRALLRESSQLMVSRLRTGREQMTHRTVAYSTR